MALWIPLSIFIVFLIGVGMPDWDSIYHKASFETRIKELTSKSQRKQLTVQEYRELETLSPRELKKYLRVRFGK